MTHGLNFWQTDGYFNDVMNWGNFGTEDNDNTSRGGHTYVEQETSTASNCPGADQGGSGQTIGEPWNYINWQQNISDTYTRIWWGWFVPNYTGTLWLQTASDDSSLVYVSEDEFGQPTKSNVRTDVKTEAGGYSDINLVVNNGGAHGRTYRSGSMSVIENKPYYIKIYFGENGGGDNMIFSWSNNGDPPNSTDNNMEFVKLDGTQNNGDAVLFYIENPIQTSNTGLGIIAAPLSSVDQGYSNNWCISVDKWDYYRSIGYVSNLDFPATQTANIIAGGGGFDGSFNNIDASFNTQGDSSSNLFVSGYPASNLFNNDISYGSGQYFKSNSI